MGPFHIRPPHAPRVEGALDIVMPRGAFGSGEHETTRSCLELLPTLPVAGARCLDLGAGTGILAIAALRLGAASVVAVDPDPGAVAACRRAFASNDLAADLIQGELGAVEGGGFGLAMANLYAPILLAVADQLLARLSPGGTLLLSGVTWEDLYVVTQRYERAGCLVQRRLLLEDYATLVLRSSDPAGAPAPGA